jgi:outer membrane protein assembly factor BamB
VGIAVIALLLRYVVPKFVPDALFIGVMGQFVGAILIILWWLFFSRAPWRERIAMLVLMIGAIFITSRIVHESMVKDAMGMQFYTMAIPVMCFALAFAAALTKKFPLRARRSAMVAAILVACSVWTLIRTEGVTGDFDNEFAWRWSETPEERLLAQAPNQPAAVPPAPTEPVKKADPVPEPQTQSTPAAAPIEPTRKSQAKAETETAAPAMQSTTPLEAPKEADWPGFRGSKRDSIIHGVRIARDWSASPPVEIWRRAVGPGWSSFAADGDRIYTQEQRGEEEIVACYNKNTGEPVWAHRDAARFWEATAGAGPRGTPTLSNGHVYSFGATGIVNALNASDGSVIWSRNAAKDTNRKIPDWGFSSSPLVIDDVLIIAAGGQLIGYDIDTGNPKWRGPKDGSDYSSPQFVTIDGIPQVLLLSRGITSVAPANGKVLWKHELPPGIVRIVQPAVIVDGEILLNSGGRTSVRRIAVIHESNRWSVKEQWVSTGLKPHFSDFVIHDGHVFGFDSSILSCIDLKNGERKWKGGKYGHGQLLLLANQDLLLILTEKGELALVNARPDEFKEVARVPAIKGKTWNHPVLVGNTLLVRNGEEMAAFRLALEGN